MMGGISCENCRGFNNWLIISPESSRCLRGFQEIDLSWHIKSHVKREYSWDENVNLHSLGWSLERCWEVSLWLCLLFFAFYFMLLNKILIVFLPFILVLQTVIQVFNLSTFHTLLEWKTEENEKKKESKRERQKKRRETRDTKEILKDKKNFTWNENLTNDSWRNEFFFRCFSWKKRREVTTEFSSFQVSWNERAMIPLLSSSLLIVQLMFICHSFLFRTQRQKGRKEREEGEKENKEFVEVAVFEKQEEQELYHAHPFSLPDHHHQHHQ